jgi:hypothetical protein
MTELKINIAPEKELLVKMLVEELGGEIIESKKPPNISKKQNKKNTGKILKKKEQEISPTFLFGKWKSLDIDAKKLRKDAWDRNGNYL